MPESSDFRFCLVDWERDDMGRPVVSDAAVVRYLDVGEGETSRFCDIPIQKVIDAAGGYGKWQSSRYLAIEFAISAWSKHNHEKVQELVLSQRGANA